MGLGNLVNFITEQNHLSGLQDFARQQFGQSNPQLAALAEADPSTFREMLPEIMKMNMTNGAVSQILNPQQEQPSALSQVANGWYGSQQGADQAAAQQGITWNTAQPQRTASFVQPQGMVQQPPSALAQIAQPQNSTPDFVKNIDRNPSLYAMLPQNIQSAYIQYKSDPAKRQADVFKMQGDQLKVAKEQQELLEKQKKAAQEEKAIQDKKESALQELDRLIGGNDEKNGILQRAIDQTSEGLIGGTVGRTGAIARLTGSPAAADLDANLETIRSNSALSKLGELKAQSPTGASGFGSLSEKELSLLTSNIRGLSTSQSEAQLKKNLAEIREELKNVRNKITSGSPLAQQGAAIQNQDAIKQELMRRGLLK